jgi:precorrin-6Y C5,15-methyltransferase (decarboxylating)
VIEVVGIAASGWSSLGRTERELVKGADRLLGGRRQLDLIPPVAGQSRLQLPSPLRPALPDLLGDSEQVRTVVLASGDPLLAGIGATLVEMFGPTAVRVHPGVSSVALAGARMGWPAETVAVVRLTGPEVDSLRRYLSPGRRLVVLSRDRSSPAAVAAVLLETGFGPSELTVLSEEERLDCVAGEWAGRPVGDLNVICVSCRTDRLSPLWSTAPGLPDDTFDSDGQLTKAEVRATALAQLRPAPGQLLWDVGAGAGSVGIEWMRTDPTCRAIAVERDPVRCSRIRANANRLGVPELVVIEGSVPSVLTDLPEPAAAFIGGGASGETVDHAWGALVGGGRLVVHAVTQETEMLVAELWRRLGGQLTRVSIELMQPIGSYSGWKPGRPVVQWSVQKPLGAQPWP